MALTIDDILDKEFLTTKDNSGYLADDVDKFLDEIIEEMENMKGTIDNQNEQLEQLRRELETAQAAAKAAEDRSYVVEQAPVQSAPSVPSAASALEGILSRAQQLADQEVEEAREKAKTILQEAEEKAARMVDDAQTEQFTLNEELQNLRTTVANCKSGMLDMLAKFKSMIEEDETDR